MVIVVLAYGVLTFRTSQAHLDEANQKLNRDLARHLVETNKLFKGDESSRRALSKLFVDVRSANPNIEIYLLDADGTILTHSATEDRIARRVVDLAPVRKFLTGDPMFPLMGDDPHHLSRPKVFSAAPIPLQGAPEAYLYIVLGGEEYESIADMLAESRLLRTRLFAVLLAAVLLFAWCVLFWSIMRRLRQLNTRVEQFRRTTLAASAPDSHLTSAAGDEIDQLDATFAQMAELISKHVHDLKQTDRLRRELIANVSHDLRTPLTALDGYLETLMIKGAELTPVQRRDYLETAARSSQRLGKLVSELFELAKLESRALPLELEVFSFADLAQDVAEEFRLIAEQNGIHLRTRIDDDLEPVRGDIQMMERVLENLLQNAINHTPAMGEVTLAAQRDSGLIRVSVADTGCGIAKEDLPYIFDRFYKVRAGALENNQGAGLGLAIAKRIIDLHGTAIHATSIMSMGTTFTFSLQTSAFIRDGSGAPAYATSA
ncbi:MAG TPA: ATP-binding protein [Burkholderiaceae bacterium]|nr:ATP-binding protein [Burkholderiaceae bacterium]